MGGSTQPKGGGGMAMQRRRVTTPPPQQGVVKPTLGGGAAAFQRRIIGAQPQPPQQKVNPPMAPNGQINFGIPGAILTKPAYYGDNPYPGINPSDLPTPAPIQQQPPMNITSPGTPDLPQQLTPELAQQLGVLRGITDFDEQGNPIQGGVPNVGGMSMFNPSVIPRTY